MLWVILYAAAYFGQEHGVSVGAMDGLHGECFIK
jgi:hypothetical protein